MLSLIVGYSVYLLFFPSFEPTLLFYLTLRFTSRSEELLTWTRPGKNSFPVVPTLGNHSPNYCIYDAFALYFSLK